MSKEIKFDIPEGTDPSRCRGCKALIYWIKTAAGRNMPVDPDGTSHFATCPKANNFRHYDPSKDPKRTRQFRLFGRLKEIEYRLNSWEQNFLRSITSKFTDPPKQLTKAEDSALEKINEDRG